MAYHIAGQLHPFVSLTDRLLSHSDLHEARGLQSNVLHFPFNALVRKYCLTEFSTALDPAFCGESDVTRP